MRSYKGIEFAKDYNRSFAEFKDDFGSNHTFNNIHPDKRAEELKKAYKIATSKTTTEDAIKAIEVNGAKIEKPNGDTSRTVNESKADPAG
jgi:hypothetical protein